MPWYAGPPLLEYLENVEVAWDHNLEDGRLPVQYVIRPLGTDYRGYAGVVAGGILCPGDAVTVLPPGSRRRSAACRWATIRSKACARRCR